MFKIDFTQEAIDKLHYERYYYPNPLVQKKNGSSVSKKSGNKT